MKKSKILSIGIICMFIVFLGAGIIGKIGNMDILDTNYKFDRAIITMNDGTKVELEIKQWKDYSDGEQIQIIAKDGKTYLVSSYNTILIKD